jgi:ribosomal protein S12 methylthiotransferase accessory factor
MTIKFSGSGRVDAAYGDFVIRTDQPAHAGGRGSEPAPFDYFLASLGTCAGVYVRNFLETRGVPTDDVYLKLDTVTDRERRMLSDVTIRVVLPEGFPVKYRNAILTAVNLCAVKRHLFEPPRMRTVVQIGETVAAESETTASPVATPDADSLAAVSVEPEP